MKDDLSWGIRHRMKGRLRMDLASEVRILATGMTYVRELYGFCQGFLHGLNPLLSVLLGLIERGRGSHIAKVLMQVFREEVYIPRMEPLIPVVD